MPLSRIRQITFWGLPLSLTSLLAIQFWGVQHASLAIAYTILLTANIGYFTNFIAIKMLFQPYEKSILGFQGVIPKNQQKIANTLASTLVDNFLSSNHWNDYLKANNYFGRILRSAESQSLAWFQEPSNRKNLTQYVCKQLSENSDSFNKIMNSVVSEIVRHESQSIDSEFLLKHGFAWINRQFEEHPSETEQVIEPIIRTLAEHIPQIADHLESALDLHIEDQDTFKRGIAKMARWSADFSSDDIKEFLFGMVASFEFRQTLFIGIKRLLKEYQSKGLNLKSINRDSDGAKSKQLNLQQLIEDAIQTIDWSQKISIFISQESNQLIIKQGIFKAHKMVFLFLNKLEKNKHWRIWLINRLTQAIQSLNLQNIIEQKAQRFSAKRMESLFKNIINEQLTFIELLGAVLGGLAGVALVSTPVFAMVSFILANIFILDQWMTNRRH